jgi:RNA polymerase sigma factor (sigma-70 family)
LLRKLSDKNIIDGVRQQDDKVLSYLYDNYYQTVKNHILKNSGTSDDVSDVFQDTIMSLYQNITDSNFSLTSDLKGYFFGIARNLWNTQLRQKKRISELNIDIAEEDDSDNLSDPALEKILSRSFKLLKPDCQTIITLFYEGSSYEEIAIKLNLKNEIYARRKKYLCKEALMELIRNDPEYKEYQRFLK